MAVKDVNFETLSYIIHENKAQKKSESFRSTFKESP
ncbi:hypothetical protein IMSAGC001_02006 [Bacteroides acidifaciens]|jgi:hypothetical protein|uniref:Uncharacterized protein n=1 Tax=Bacteroides acidifaciens TaxID=85831 RepID=A0A7J0A2S8_9BACE|nr:hypothetical protein IMSAGC001_02006 [Bacteroides acidifaciens]